MLLLNKTRDPRAFFALGQVCLSVGILGSLLGRTESWTGLSDFALGLFTGLAAVLLGASIVFNITGLRLRRRQR